MENRILVVDDMEINRDILEEILKTEYLVMKADNGKEAMEALHKYDDDICAVLLDLVMPEMDGFTVLLEMQEEGFLDYIPVLVISGETSLDTEKKCFDYGVADFIQKPFERSIVKRRVNNVVNLFAYQNQLENRLARQADILRNQNRILQMQARKLQENNTKIIDVLGNVVESRNLESGEHIRRVKGFVWLLGRQMMKDYPEYGLTREMVDMIAEASALHDIGKIAIPDNVLLKPGKLTKEEFDLMKTHTTKGCDILNGIDGIWEEDYRKLSYDICRHHHERYDGRGYPDGLQGDDIPIAAQIVSVADVYDALVSERVYKGAYSKEEAYDMIVQGECGIFSPKLLESLCKVREEFECLADNNQIEKS